MCIMSTEYAFRFSLVKGGKVEQRQFSSSLLFAIIVYMYGINIIMLVIFGRLDKNFFAQGRGIIKLDKLRSISFLACNIICGGSQAFGWLAPHNDDLTCFDWKSIYYFLCNGWMWTF